MSIRKRLVLTFDAFGTLFKPKQAIGKAYVDVAAKHRLPGLAPLQINQNFKNAFKDAQRRYPNYGKAAGIGPRQWWTNIIEDSFAPVIKPDDLPKGIVPNLLQIFSTSEGYQTFPDVIPCFADLRRLKSAVFQGPATTYEIVVGVITNSDDRVLSILNSLCLTASHRRSPSCVHHNNFTKQDDEVFDFVVTSYDIGAEKPDRRIFDAAKICAALPDDETDVEHIYFHIGDDPIKDYEGAIQAGWNAACVGGVGRNEDQKPEDKNVFFLENLHALNPYIINDILELENRYSRS